MAGKHPGWLALATWAQRRTLAREVAATSTPDVHFSWGGWPVCATVKDQRHVSQFAELVTCRACRKTLAYSMCYTGDLVREIHLVVTERAAYLARRARDILGIG